MLQKKSWNQLLCVCEIARPQSVMADVLCIRRRDNKMEDDTMFESMLPVCQCSAFVSLLPVCLVPRISANICRITCSVNASRKIGQLRLSVPYSE